MFFEHVNPYLRLFKNGSSWHDFLTFEMGSSYVSAISWNIYEIDKNKADSIISDVKKNDGPQKLGWSLYI